MNGRFGCGSDHMTAFHEFTGIDFYRCGGEMIVFCLFETRFRSRIIRHALLRSRFSFTSIRWLRRLSGHRYLTILETTLSRGTHLNSMLHVGCVNHKTWPLVCLNHKTWPLCCLNHKTWPLCCLNHKTWHVGCLNHKTWLVGCLNNKNDLWAV